jgi:maleylacetate reductase
VVLDPRNLEARSQALYAAWLGGVALGAVGMALHHKLCHTLGGSFNLPHAETHTVILPHAVAYNALATEEAMTRVARALGSDSAARGLYDLAASLGAPTSLAALGLGETALDRAADLAVQNPYYNPRPVTRDCIRALLQDAFEGRRP